MENKFGDPNNQQLNPASQEINRQEPSFSDCRDLASVFGKLQTMKLQGVTIKGHDPELFKNAIVASLDQLVEVSEDENQRAQYSGQFGGALNMIDKALADTGVTREMGMRQAVTAILLANNQQFQGLRNLRDRLRDPEGHQRRIDEANAQAQVAIDRAAATRAEWEQREQVHREWKQTWQQHIFQASDIQSPTIDNEQRFNAVKDWVKQEGMRNFREQKAYNENRNETLAAQVIKTLKEGNPFGGVKVIESRDGLNTNTRISTAENTPGEGSPAYLRLITLKLGSDLPGGEGFQHDVTIAVLANTIPQVPIEDPQTLRGVQLMAIDGRPVKETAEWSEFDRNGMKFCLAGLDGRLIDRLGIELQLANQLG